MLPISADDDVYMQIFVPDILDPDYFHNVKLLVNEKQVPIEAYTSNLPNRLPQGVLNENGPYQQFKFIFSKDPLIASTLLDRIWMPLWLSVQL